MGRPGVRITEVLEARGRRLGSRGPVRAGPRLCSSLGHSLRSRDGAPHASRHAHRPSGEEAEREGRTHCALSPGKPELAAWPARGSTGPLAAGEGRGAALFTPLPATAKGALPPCRGPRLE